MVFKLKGNDVIKEQDIEVTESLIGIYGYNNSRAQRYAAEKDIPFKFVDEFYGNKIIFFGRRRLSFPHLK